MISRIAVHCSLSLRFLPFFCFMEQTSPATRPALQPGDTVPDFTAETTSGPLHFSDLNGKLVVLYFYPPGRIS